MNSPAKNFAPRGMATAIGSFPHPDPGPALELIEKYLPQAPVWPQLPKRGLKENMCPQFSSGLPALKLDEGEGRIYFSIGDDLPAELEKFYLKVIEDDLEHFALTPDYALGFHALLKHLEGGRHYPSIKGCVTGPVTFGLTITDGDRKPSLYHPEIFDAITKTAALKARWQVRKLAPFCDLPIISIDEPYLASVGSALVSLQVEEVIDKLNEVISAVHQEGALAGVHCCANTDWSILMRTGVDILSFDAFGYAKNLLLYADHLKEFFRRGGFLAWGITPVGDEIENQDVETLWPRLIAAWERLEELGFSQRELAERSFITPSCGMGTVTPGLCEKILRVNLEISFRVGELGERSG